jgi:predicted dehydrogenase
VNMKKSLRFLIVGCGELGSRHLQSISALPNVEEITVVDSNPASLALGKERVADVPNQTTGINFKWVSSLEEFEGSMDLCVVATLAGGRCSLIKEIFEKCDVSKMIVEKIVSQSVSEYEDLLRFVEKENYSVWVNCNTRGFPIHQHIKSQLNPDEPIIFTSVGGNHGLANNGIHVADIFLFHEGSGSIESVGSAIDPHLHASKRGSNYFDLSGTLQGKTKRGSHFSLSYAGDHYASEHITISTKSYRCIVDHIIGWACENEGDGSSEWKQIPFDRDIYVSHLTKKFVHDILTKGACELPTLQECFPAHRYILGTLNPYFNQLLGRESNLCPVT